MHMFAKTYWTVHLRTKIFNCMTFNFMWNAQNQNLNSDSRRQNVITLSPKVFSTNQRGDGGVVDLFFLNNEVMTIPACQWAVNNGLLPGPPSLKKEHRDEGQIRTTVLTWIRVGNNCLECSFFLWQLHNQERSPNAWPPVPTVPGSWRAFLAKLAPGLLFRIRECGKRICLSAEPMLRAAVSSSRVPSVSSSVQSEAAAQWACFCEILINDSFNKLWLPHFSTAFHPYRCFKNPWKKQKRSNLRVSKVG